MERCRAAVGGGRTGVAETDGFGRRGALDRGRYGVSEERQTLGGCGPPVLRSGGQAGQLPGCGVVVDRKRSRQSAGGLSVVPAARVAEDAERRAKTGVPEDMVFRTKPQLAMAQIEAALSAGHPRGVVLADAAYGDETGWRERLAGHGLRYAVGVRPGTTVWWGEHQPVPEGPRSKGPGRPRRRLRRDASHRPISIAEVADALPAQAWRTVSWREGASGPLRSRFARTRVVAAHRDRPRAEEWLIVEWPEGAERPAHYWFSNLSKRATWPETADTVMSRWQIERDYQELKQELGLGHYEGRNWRGFHHHASLCIAAYGFLMLERLAGSKKNAAGFKAPALPEGFRPRGARTPAAS